MPLPEIFSEWEHLQSTLIKFQNKQVRDWFSDLGGDEWNPDISTSRGSLRYACTLKDTDTAAMTFCRLYLFSDLLRGRFEAFFSAEGDETQTTTLTYDNLRESKPQIILWFLEDVGDVEPGYAPVKGRISFRLMNKTVESINQSDLTFYANRVKSEFALNGGYVWRKGRLMASYADWSKGLQLQVLCRNESDGSALINKVLDVLGESIDNSVLKYSETADAIAAYPVIPPTDTILGKATRLPRRRPIADVRFAYAELFLGKGLRRITLVDRIGFKPNPVVAI